ncbi:Eisosome component PIL1/LSP1, partial [Gongronella butleri]
LDQYQQYRHAIKSIREREDRLSDIREKKRTLNSRIANLTKTSAKSPKLRELKKELESLEKDTHDTEMEMGDFKRFALREAFYLRFNAMTEYAEKTSMIAGFGKYIVDLLDIRPTPAAEANRRPYEKGPEAALILADAIQAVDDWHPRASDERPTLA